MSRRTIAPLGYYGPEWFTGGIFIGAGPWFHGTEGFHGHVNNHFHPNTAITAPCQPEVRDPTQTAICDKVAHFKGNEVRDGRGQSSAKSNVLSTGNI